MTSLELTIQDYLNTKISTSVIPSKFIYIQNVTQTANIRTRGKWLSV